MSDWAKLIAGLENVISTGNSRSVVRRSTAVANRTVRGSVSAEGSAHVRQIFVVTPGDFGHSRILMVKHRVSMVKHWYLRSKRLLLIFNHWIHIAGD
jgi:hypothetical protein